MPRQTKGRRMRTCFHEAGHVLARWFFGYDSHCAWVLSMEEIKAGKWPVDDRGRICEFGGAVERYDIDSPLMTLAMIEESEAAGRISPAGAAFLRQDAPIRAEIELIQGIAGPVAQACFCRISLVQALMDGGMGDLRHNSRVSSAWFPDDQLATVRRLAEKRAVALIRSPKGWAAVTAIAYSLYGCGKIECDELNAMCEEAYGRKRVDRYAWMPHWPPTLEQLRAGDVQD